MKNKELEILDYISECESSITIDQLCLQFHLNPRSIRYYMDYISRELKDAEITLDRGTYHIGSINKIKEFLNDTNNISASTSIKKFRMLFQFIFTQQINLSKVAQELDISRVTAKQYFVNMESQLVLYGLKTKTDVNGVTLLGSEEAIRSVQLQTLLDYQKLSDNKKISLLDLTDLYTNEKHFISIDKFLYDVQHDMQSILTDYSFNICRNYLLCAIRRIQANKVMMDSNQSGFLLDSNEYQTINKHINQLETSYHVTFDQSELVKFTDLLIGSHYSFSSVLKENSWFENNLFVTKLIAILVNKSISILIKILYFITV